MKGDRQLPESQLPFAHSTIVCRIKSGIGIRSFVFCVFYVKDLVSYRVIFKKVSFGIFSMILVSKEKKNFTMKSKDIVLSLGKFS